MRSYSAWNLRSLLLLAARYSLRWSSRVLSVDDVIGLLACIDTYFLAKLIEVETLPSGQVLLSCPSWNLHSIGTIWSPPTSHPASSWISPFRLIPFVMMAVGHQLDEISPVPSPTFTTSRSPYTGGFFAVAFPGSSPLPWPSLTSKQLDSLLSRFRVAISVLQDSLYVAGCCFASLSQGVTSLQHTRSPRCTGCLLHGLLEVTMTGLAPVSRQWLIRTHYLFSVNRVKKQAKLSQRTLSEDEPK